MRSSAGGWLDLGTGRFTGQEQSVVAVLPGESVLSPAAQGVHAPSPIQFLNCPATHGEQAVPFAPWLPSCRRERGREMRVARLHTIEHRSPLWRTQEPPPSHERTIHKTTLGCWVGSEGGAPGSRSF